MVTISRIVGSINFPYFNFISLTRKTMEPTNKEIQEVKNFLEEQHGREFTWEEATKGVRDLRMFAEIALRAWEEECRRKKLLEESPKGFHLDRSGTCKICGIITSGENSWYDKNGFKCMTCQKAINQRIIPISVVKNEESWYSQYDLESYFNIYGPFLKKYIKQGILKERVILTESKKVHCRLFLIRDNKDTLPPKKILKPQAAKTMHKGEEYYTTENWYEFADFTVIEQVRKYKIVNCLAETLTQPIKSGRLLTKAINPIFVPT